MAFLQPSYCRPTTEQGAAAMLSDMTEEEVVGAIHLAMPFPVISILHMMDGDFRLFVVNMDIAELHKSQRLFHIRFRVPVLADRPLMMKAITAARLEALTSIAEGQ